MPILSNYQSFILRSAFDAQTKTYIYTVKSIDDASARVFKDLHAAFEHIQSQIYQSHDESSSNTALHSNAAG